MKPDLMMFLAVAVVAMVTVAVTQDCETQPPAAECRAHLPAWFYNTETGRCQRRGCHNLRVNRYETEEICQEKCGGSICQLPAAVGVCRGRLRRYFFDARIGQCRPFFYGGCGGNANNFFRKSECRAACEGTTTSSEGGAIDQN